MVMAGIRVSVMAIDGQTGSRPDQRTRRCLFVIGLGPLVMGSVKDLDSHNLLKGKRM